jgi:hypothetical protein
MEEPARVRPLGQWLSAACDTRTLVLADLDVTLDLIELLAAD